MATLNSSKLQRAGHYRETWEVVADAATTLEDLLSPKFWVHVASRLRRMSVIHVLSEDESWYAELIILGSGVGFAKVKCLRFVNFYDGENESADVPARPTDMQVKWGGPHAKYRVVRLSDSTVLKEGFANKQDADSWARQHEALIAA